MALTLSQRDTLTTNATFLGRVRTAVRYHASFLLAGTPTPAQQSWCARVFWSGMRSSQIAADLAPQLCNDPAITDSSVGDGSDVTDGNYKPPSILYVRIINDNANIRYSITKII